MDDKELYSQINQVVNKWVSEVLKSRFKEKPYGGKPRSLWDKFKQGVTNWWWGPKGDKYNPYKWRNRFGDELGVSESFNPSVFTLHEYKDIRLIVESVEDQLDKPNDEFDKLRLMGIVYSAAERLKEMLFNTLRGKVLAPANVPKGEDGKSTDIVDNPRAKAEKGTNGDVEKNPEAAGRREKIPTPAAAAASEDEGKTSASETDTIDAGDKTAKRSITPKADGAEASREGSKRATQKVGAEEKAKPASSEATPESEGSNQKDEALMDYIQVKGKLKDFLIAFHDEFPSMFGKERAAEKQKEIKNWFGAKIKEIESKSVGKMNPDDRVKFLKETANSFVDEIGKITEMDSDKMRLLMSSYLRDGRIRRDLLPERTNGEEVEQGDQTDDGLGLEAYLFDGENRISFDSAIKRLDGFMEDPMKSQGVGKSDDRVARLKNWWNEEKKQIAEKSDKLGYIEQMLLSTESYLAKIGLQLGKSPKFVKGLMIKHIQKKSSR